jgi:hypothetical protein
MRKIASALGATLMLLACSADHSTHSTQSSQGTLSSPLISKSQLTLGKNEVARVAVGSHTTSVHPYGSNGPSVSAVDPVPGWQL